MAEPTHHLAAFVLLALCILSFPLPRASAVKCTASDLATGLESCLATSAHKDDCCDYVINDVVYPCGITQVCSLQLSSEVLEFLDYCRFKCHGLRPFGPLSASS
ncbi:unnamed protein product [Calypogeia fissa]